MSLINSETVLNLFSSFKKLLPQKAAETPVVQLPRVACDFGKTKIVFLEIQKTPQAITLTKFQKIPRSTQPEKDAELLKQAFEAGAYTTNRVRISVKGQGVIIRFIQFPTMKIAELRSAVAFEVDQYIPFKSHEVVWDLHILEENVSLAVGGTGMNVLLVAVKRDELYTMIQTFQNAGLEIEMIDVDALASINALEFFYPEQFNSSTGILDIGTEISTLSIIHHGRPRFIRDISYGGLDILKRLKRKLGLSHEHAMEQIEVDRQPTPEATVVLKESLGDLISDLKVSLNYYFDQVPSAEPVKTLFIGGGGGYHPIVIETLGSQLGFSVETMQILGKFQLANTVDAELVKKNQGLLPVTLGLCVRDK